jgi:CMP-2-keto-3-deoxyoctulosonic acid synthetase
MMRFLENDIAISSLITDKAIIGVDHPEDIQKVELLMKNDELMKEYKYLFLKNN